MMMVVSDVLNWDEKLVVHIVFQGTKISNLLSIRDNRVVSFIALYTLDNGK